LPAVPGVPDLPAAPVCLLCLLCLYNLNPHRPNSWCARCCFPFHSCHCLLLLPAAAAFLCLCLCRLHFFYFFDGLDHFFYLNFLSHVLGSIGRGLSLFPGSLHSRFYRLPLWHSREVGIPFPLVAGHSFPMRWGCTDACARLACTSRTDDARVPIRRMTVVVSDADQPIIAD
jgi:hypothetical protein